MSDRFERQFANLFVGHTRLKELQNKATTKGLRGEEVYEFIALDRRELSDKSQEL